MVYAQACLKFFDIRWLTRTLKKSNGDVVRTTIHVKVATFSTACHNPQGCSKPRRR